MKKIITLALVLLLAISFAACGNQGTQDPVQDDPNAVGNDVGSSETDGSAMESLIDWMRDGNFSYDFTMRSEYMGEVTEATGSAAMAGGKFAMTTESTQEGVSTTARIVIMDGYSYIIDDVSRLIMKLANADPELTGHMPTDYEDMTPIGSGEGEVNGKTLPYEEYSVDNTTVKYYMDGNTVYAIESAAEGTSSLMIITNASNTAPASAFDLPEGYIEVSM